MSIQLNSGVDRLCHPPFHPYLLCLERTNASKTLVFLSLQNQDWVYVVRHIRASMGRLYTVHGWAVSDWSCGYTVGVKAFMCDQAEFDISL